MGVSLLLLICVGMLFLSEKKEVRVRGGLKVTLIVKRNERVFEYDQKVVLRPGDRIRIQVEDHQGGFLWVLGWNDRREVTFYYGQNPKGTLFSILPGSTLLPESLELDASQYQEAIVVVLSKQKYTPTQLVEWLQPIPWEESLPPSIEALPQTRIAVIPIRKEGL